MTNNTYHDDTIAIHGGFTKDTATGATAVPIYQSAAFQFSTAEQLQAVFAGREPGYVYTRIANPTTYALERRLTELEGGIGCVATSSGMAAITSVMMALLRTGDEILTSTGIFGGSVSLFEKTLGRFGVKTAFVDATDTDRVADAISDSTRVIFIETISNPLMGVPDIPAISEIAKTANIPLIVDSTVTPPCLFKGKEFGVDVIIHSTTKYINGHGTAIGGAIVDTGHYNWKNGPFDDLRARAKKAGGFALLAHLRNLICRDIGGCPAPMNSFLMLQGLETLAPRMTAHCRNALALAEFLRNHPAVEWVNYPGLQDSPYHRRVQDQFGGRGGGLLTFGVGSQSAAFKCINALKLVKNMTNLGDTRTLALHPASTIFHDFDPDERKTQGVGDDMIRISVGIEEMDDLVNDFQHALAVIQEES